MVFHRAGASLKINQSWHPTTVLEVLAQHCATAAATLTSCFFTKLFMKITLMNENIELLMKARIRDDGYLPQPHPEGRFPAMVKLETVVFPFG